VRAVLEDAAASALYAIKLHYLVQNQRPEVLDVAVGGTGPARDLSGQGAGGGEPPANGNDHNGGRGPAQQAALDLLAAKAEGEGQMPRVWSALRQIRWHAGDLDGDTLVFRLYYQREGDDVWIPIELDRPLETTDYAWDTDSVPDGTYRVKVAASDERANPADAALIGESVSDRVDVDNRRPVVRDLGYDPASRELTGEAVDNLSRIQALELAVDGGRWQLIAPRDRVYDSRRESFVAVVDQLAPGPHAVAVRATDEMGNVGVEQLFIEVGNAAAAP
jgi:hypothetical protein